VEGSTGQGRSIACHADRRVAAYANGELAVPKSVALFLQLALLRDDTILLGATLKKMLNA
jgi:hypothetical protein